MWGSQGFLNKSRAGGLEWIPSAWALGPLLKARICCRDPDPLAQKRRQALLDALEGYSRLVNIYIYTQMYRGRGYWEYLYVYMHNERRQRTLGLGSRSLHELRSIFSVNPDDMNFAKGLRGHNTSPIQLPVSALD